MSPSPPIARRSDFVVVAFFLCGMLLPLIDSVAHVDHSRPLGENRPPAKLPPIPTTETALRAFPREFDRFYGDTFGFRRRLIRLNALEKFSFGVSSSDLVIIGKRGQLFFTGDSSVDNFRGLVPMREAELRAWKEELEARRDWLASMNIRYLFLVPPNKETVYGADMPSRYTKEGPTRLDQLVSYMKAYSSFEVIDVREMLKARATEKRVYSLTDTHWTDDGAYIGYREVTARLHNLYPSITPRSYESFHASPPFPWYGDLSQMLGMNDLLAEPRVDLVPDQPYVSRINPARQGVGGGRLTYMLGPAGKPRAVVFHDSFFLPPEERGDPSRASTAAKLDHQSPFRMVALMAEHFSESTFKWTHSFEPGLIEHERPDVVVQELVERYVGGAPPRESPRVRP